jgi:hypothetical protein
MNTQQQNTWRGKHLFKEKVHLRVLHSSFKLNDGIEIHEFIV